MNVHTIDLLTRMLYFDPARRITPSEALQHPYFNEIKQKGYLTAYQQHNQHTFGDHATPVPLSVALNPVPMNADREKVGELPENLKVNVSFSLTLSLSHSLTLSLSLARAMYALCLTFLSFSLSLSLFLCLSIDHQGDLVLSQARQCSLDMWRTLSSSLSLSLFLSLFFLLYGMCR